MRSRFPRTLPLVLIVLASACGGHHAYEVKVLPAPSRPARLASAPSRPDPLVALGDVLQFRSASQRQYVLDVAKVQAVESARAAAVEQQANRDRQSRSAPMGPVEKTSRFSPDTAAAPSFGDRGCVYASLIRSVWLRDAEWAIGIAMRESHCHPGARNPSGASGLFQMLNHGDIFGAVGCATAVKDTTGRIVGWADVRWADPSCNVRAAWQLYQGAGRAPWNL